MLAHLSNSLPPLRRPARLEGVLFPLLDTLQELDLLEVPAALPVRVELVFESRVRLRALDVRAPVHGGLVERRELLCLLRARQRREECLGFARARALCGLRRRRC